MLTVLCYILFVLAAIVLIVVVLLQEGRGGGFGEALGVHGRETFGVGSKGINTFTAWTAAVFLGAALLITYMNRQHSGDSLLSTEGTTIESLPGASSAPAGNTPDQGATPPSGN
ncbi:MAG: preprotein translocase subunit SecG [Planctomycetes bacterium]|nr:preprotein translocase subunit SecG [Planctomycetota bacterium]